MSVLILLILAGGLVAGGFLLAFVWAVLDGQFDDTVTPPLRVLVDDSDSTFHGGPVPALPADPDAAHSAPSRGAVHVESRC